MPILLTTLSKFRSIPWIDGVVRAIINVIVSVYEQVLPAFYCRQGLLFALWRLALNIKGVAVFFHRDKALERLVLSFVQECLDGQASILIIQPFGTHSDNEVV